MRGPIDYVIVGFEGNPFDGSILQALTDAIDSGAIGLVALAVVRKDKDGAVTKVDIVESGDKYAMEFAERYSPKSSAIGDDDIEEAAELLENDTAAALLVIEHLWARMLKRATLNAGGVLVAEGRIHPEGAAQLTLQEG